jgi:hypothetical protein
MVWNIDMRWWDAIFKPVFDMEIKNRRLKKMFLRAVFERANNIRLS